MTGTEDTNMDHHEHLTWKIGTRNGLTVYELADGRTIPHVCGSDGDEDPPDPQDPPTPTPTPGDPLSQLQSELNRVATRESAAGKRQAERELLERTGFQNRTELEAFVTAAREREEQELTETQRLQRAAEQREQQAAAREAQANEREHRANIRQAIVDAGVGNHLDDPDLRQARRQLVERLVDVEVGADEATIQNALASVRATAPELFAATDPNPDPNPAPRAPSGVPRGQAPRTPPANGKTRVDEHVERIKARTGIQ